VAIGLNLDRARLRAETPGCAHVTHFNHAGSSLMPSAVLSTVVDYLNLEATIGGYEAADEAEKRLEGVYASVAKLIGASPNEIAIVENATRAWDMAFYAIDLKPGDRILTSMAEYASNVLAFLQAAEKGVLIEVVPNDEFGQLDVDALARMLDERVKVIAVSHMPTNGGLVQPAAEIGQLARDSDAIYILDACQTAGQVTLDVDEIGCDVLTASARKFLRGPRGIGFLYVREQVIEKLTPPFIDLHAARWTGPREYELRRDARRFENWEANLAGKLGLGAAIDYALDIGSEVIWECIQERAAVLRSKLSGIPGVEVHDLGKVKGGIVTFSLDGVPSKSIYERLKGQRINVHTSTVSSTRFDMEARGLTEIVRSSVHYLTTDEEIDQLVGAIAEMRC
jgi:cysteine desulfurase/selenocysteine lyase